MSAKPISKRQTARDMKKRYTIEKGTINWFSEVSWKSDLLPLGLIVLLIMVVLSFTFSFR